MKKINSIFSSLFILTLLFSCCKKNDNVVVDESPILNGYFMRDFNAQPNGSVGTPNVYLGDSTDYIKANYFIMSYPNPAQSTIIIDVKSVSSSSINKIWITPANWNTGFTDNSTPFKNKNTLVVGSNTKVYETTDSLKNFYINTENFQEGYYRVYLNVDGKTFYDNIAIYH